MANVPAQWADNPQLVNLVIGASAAWGLIQCLFGYRLFRWMLALTGFAMGAVAGGAAGFQLHGTIGAVIGGLVLGLLGAVMMVVLYFVGVFAMGVMLGALAGLLIAGPETGFGIAAAVVLGLIGGILAVVIQKLLIILSTAMVGSYLVILAAIHFAFGGLDLQRLSNDTTYISDMIRQRPAILAFWLGLALVGVIVQYLSSPKKHARKPVEPPPVPLRGRPAKAC
jgi:hypothetical protein